MLLFFLLILIMVFIVKSKRVYLNLPSIDFPLTAITSIVHRVTGILLFISIPLVLYFFKLSIESESSFLVAVTLFSKTYIKALFYFLLFLFMYHFFNGVKHIIMDLGFFDGKTSGKNFNVFLLFFVLFFIILSILI